MSKHREKQIFLKRKLLHMELFVTGLLQGQDLLLSVTGGELSHIGSVSMAIPRQSLTGQGNSATVSTFVYPGHMDDKIGDLFAKELCSMLQCHVVVTCGIHFEELSPEQLVQVELECRDMLEKLKNEFI
ncbi:MAG: hypothetical protein PHE02_01790 [Lachnospiraceae bacterium]|nr:hypothetical protein [Lachnospiraceae bacterium]